MFAPLYGTNAQAVETLEPWAWPAVWRIRASRRKEPGERPTASFK